MALLWDDLTPYVLWDAMRRDMADEKGDWYDWYDLTVEVPEEWQLVEAAGMRKFNITREQLVLAVALQRAFERLGVRRSGRHGAYTGSSAG